MRAWYLVSEATAAAMAAKGFPTKTENGKWKVLCHPSGLMAQIECELAAKKEANSS